MSAAVTIKISALVQVGSGREEHIGRRVTAKAGEPVEDLRDALTLALRQVNEEIRELLQ